MRSHHQRFARTVSAMVGLALAVLVGTNIATAGGAVAGAGWWEPPNRPAPDSAVNVSGEPFKGTDSSGAVRGYADIHNHLMTNEAFGGKLVCGKPFSEAGVADALKDCPEHYPDGKLAYFENLTSGQFGHDPVGWPSFKYWPNTKTLTHQQNYYAWIERAWRGGTRLMVTDLTSNGVICNLMPRDRSCDEMTSIRLQAAKTREMQAYIDNVYGGPGKGFFRIVESSAQAREVIKQGKLAIVLGIETSEPFGCKMILDVPQCSKADIDRGLDEVYNLGVRSMFLCHKFDNALCGVRFDSGTLGGVIGTGQFTSTGTIWTTEQCKGAERDNPINGATPENAGCNTRGLTQLGEHALRGMMNRGMIVEVDHMGVKAADKAMSIMESADYPGLVSSHSWMDPNWTERVYKAGGFIAMYPSGSESMVTGAGQTAALRATYKKGLGIGSDMNGLGGWPAARGADAPNKVKYPFTSYDGGSTIDRQVTGERVWDVNVDGAAHYGLLPDWIQDIRNVGGESVVKDMFRGAESYLQTMAGAEEWTDPTNLAAGAPATASSTEWHPWIDYAPGKAVDGDVGTRWASNWSDNQWLYVDLGQQQSVGRVLLNWEAAYASGYRIEVWDEGNQAWRQVWSTDAGDGGIDVAKFTPVSTQWVRIHGTARGTRYGYSLWEVGAFAR